MAKYIHKHLFPPSFANINGKRYIVPGWVEVEDHITFSDIEHINPYANIKKEEWRVQGSKGNIYTVSKLRDKYSCTCPAGKFRGTCKHIKQTKEQHGNN